MASNVAKKLGSKGERMVPELHKGTLIYAEHITRYEVAVPIVKDKIVLDIASGSGYGSKILSRSAKKVYGVDVDRESVEYSSITYGGDKIKFLLGDGESIPLKDNSVDVVITLETIEHVKDYRKFVKEISRVLRPDGLAIISTPNDLEFAEGNHFHLHEFKYDELKKLVSEEFKNIDPYFQATWKYVGIGSEEDLQKEGKITADISSYSSPGSEQYLYFYLLCSNRMITEEVRFTGALGEHYSDRMIIGAQMQNEQNISDHRIIIDDHKKIIEECKIKNAELESRLSDTTKSLESKTDELKAVLDSKTYAILNKASRIKRKIVR